MDFKWIFDLIFPRYCLGCGQEGVFLCPDCAESIPLRNSVLCPVCGLRSPSGKICSRCERKNPTRLSGLLVASDWENQLLRRLIYAYKYDFAAELSDFLSDLMTDFLSPRLKIFGSDQIVLVPVPLHPRRLAWRGFNQSELLAKKICSRLNLTLIPDALKRKRFTPPQVDFGSSVQRMKNVKNAFKISDKTIVSDKKTYVLIDDVCTTGSTLNECARELKSAGAKDVWGFVLARG